MMESKTTIKVELIYDSDCPNVEPTKAVLKQALALTGLDANFQQWDRADRKSPKYAQRYGSPTILVDRKDIAGESSDDSCQSCRIYKDENGRLSGIPSLKLITAAIEKAAQAPPPSQADILHDRKPARKGIFAVVPAIGVILIPGISCPACWPAYAGLLTAMGLGFVNYTPYLLPITVVLLIIALFALAFRAKRRRGYAPALTGAIAATAIIAGKFVLGMGLLTYTGIALLIVASIWNLWPKKNKDDVSCSFCVQTEDITKQR